MKNMVPIIVILLILLGLIGLYFWNSSDPNELIDPPTTTDNSDNGVLEVTPDTSEGDVLETGQTDDRIVVTFPQAGDTISSPLVVTGEARGMWYFEATFPLTVVNWDGLIIGQGYAQAEGEWMTEDFVPFEGTVTFESDTSVSDRGAVILHRSNESGLPEHDAAVEVPVTFGE